MLKIEVRTTERYTVDTDPQNILEPPTDGEYLCSNLISTYYIFSTCGSISTWYNIDEAKADGKIKRYDIRQTTLKQGKTHCGRGLITDPIAHIVTDADVDIEQNQPSGVESIEMHVSVTSKYESRSSAVSDVVRLFFWFA